ncbi:pseudouridylate synthase TRUB1-like [Panonychus citri]|uniref:pseudouridylate synthase TRUB1-like n=1 Tax=Panonychus citri TaxID=50023 RepID=UPI0023079200|nr:pseudouridylate synthase TRUB1-like [Panonychus citri]
MISKSLAPTVKGIFPFFKEPGINNYTIIKWVKLHITYECVMNNQWYNPYVDIYRALEPFASGVLAIAIGKPSLYMKYLKFCDSNYTLDLRMGQSTITDYFESPTIDSKPFDHIKLEDVEKVARSFIGPQIQALPKARFLRPLGIYYGDYDQSNDEEIKSWDQFLHINNQMRFVAGDRQHHRKVTCHSIEVIKFNPPDLTLQLSCDVPFSVRSFAEKFFTELDTCGSFTRILRTKEGPFTLDQCIDRTDLYLKYLMPALRKHTEPFIDHVRPHLDKLPFHDDVRMGKQR